MESNGLRAANPRGITRWAIPPDFPLDPADVARIISVEENDTLVK